MFDIVYFSLLCRLCEYDLVFIGKKIVIFKQVFVLQMQPLHRFKNRRGLKIFFNFKNHEISTV